MGIDGGIKKTVNKAVELYKKYEDPISKTTSGITTAMTVKGNIKDAYDAAKLIKSRGFTTASNLLKADRQKGLIDPVSRWHIMGKVSFAGNIVSTVTGAVSIPDAIGTAYKDIRTAARDGSFKNIVNAASSTLDASVKSLSAVVDGSRIAQTVVKMRSSYKAAATAFKAFAPNATKKMVAAAAKSVMKSSLEGAGKVAAKQALTSTLKKVATKEAGVVAKTLIRTSERAAVRAATKEAVKAGLEAGTKAAAGTAGKLLSRFTPGLNIAIAAYDTVQCVKTLADPNASTGKKVCSCVTAAGSILAATNIPVVSQIGAGISAVSSFISSWF